MTDKEVARLFDSNGTIYISKDGRLKIAIDQEDYLTLRDLRDEFGGFVEVLVKAREGVKSVYNWNIHEKKCGDFLGAMLLHTKTKRQHVLLGLHYLLDKADMRRLKHKVVEVRWRANMIEQLRSLQPRFPQDTIVLLDPIL